LLGASATSDIVKAKSSKHTPNLLFGWAPLQF
jgi:hypothetical protein